MKKVFLVLIILMAAWLTACSDGSAQQTPQPAQTPQVTQPAQTPQPAQTAPASPTSQASAGTPSPEPENVALLCADFSGGDPDGDIEEYDLGYSGDLTPEMLLDGLSELTGLDFAADIFWTELGFAVHWKEESTLIADHDTRTPKEGFEFFDVDSMRWFMMDSLYHTLTKNFDEDNVFYSKDGERGLEFEALNPVNVFPANIPYQGSTFYFEHADGKGLVTSAEDASAYLTDKLTEAGYDMSKTGITADPDGGDPWFGEMAVWYFNLKTPKSGADAEEKTIAVTFDWEVWEYDALEDEWSLWD